MQQSNYVTICDGSVSEGSDRWHKPLSGVIQKIHKHNTFTFTELQYTTFFYVFLNIFSPNTHSYNNATPRSHILKEEVCVYWLQEEQAELLQLQVQAPGRQEQLLGELISEITDMHRMNMYLELQVHGLAIAI